MAWPFNSDIGTLLYFLEVIKKKKIEKIAILTA